MSADSERYDPQSVEMKWQEEWSRRGTNLFTEQDLREAEDPYYNLMMFPYPSAEGLHIGNIYAYTGADVNGRYWRLRGKDVFEPIGFDAFGIHSENYALKVGTNPNDLIPKNIENFTHMLKRFGGMFDWNHVVNTTDMSYYKWTQWVFLKLYEGGLVERREAPVNWCPSCMTVLANEQVIQGECERCESAVEQRQLPQWFFRITDYAPRLLDNIADIDWSDITRKAQANWIGRSVGAEVDFALAGDDGVLRVFTTRPDTLFGATYMVLAPEHPLVERVTTDAQAAVVGAYVQIVAKADLVERQKTDKEKTGVFTGGHAINPVNGERIPIWIADYVLMGYGTGAIMAVPGHDERDFEFATAFELPIVRVIADEGENADSPLAGAFPGDGVLVNSGRFDGMSVADGKAAIIASLENDGTGEAQTNYRLHDWCVSRQRYWGPPIPIIHCERCGAVPVPEADLPVELPYLQDFRPDDSGISPLARVADWYHTTCPRCSSSAYRETDVTDNFLCSGWYFLRYPSTDRIDAALDGELTAKWLPVDSYIGGNEHAVLHLMYARFLTMALSDLGVIEFDEPFTRFRAHGLLIREGRKMSKSKGNVIVPDDIIAEYGADAMRVYLLFLGPYEQGGDYQGKGIQGPYGFLNRLWQSVLSASNDPADGKVERAMHKTIRQLTEQVPELQYNTAIAAMMEYLNVAREGGRTPSRAELEPLVIMLAPFAPHLAEELYERLGHNSGLFDSATWPEYDETKTVDDSVEVAVQVNGKMRGRINIVAGADEDAVVAAASGVENVARHLDGKTVRKIVHVPDRLLNIVVSS
ncbi:MAG: leucine--tRNA ligase [Pseudomonadales bacterium]|jgi:leucyl-tRNA synthetase|nr:leucine--tRNA ligase [Pseudomonadales bacterium]MDP6470226.1 leucine--tRNA ligase [Pseudomonadales bacterium]MDP6827132.1 leucine--tRNA ligase [Pseudomonadales bacterium]MDP6971570.1 leucine--tRNA ligase [Pseudomonadales bacterium]